MRNSMRLNECYLCLSILSCNSPLTSVVCIHCGVFFNSNLETLWNITARSSRSTTTAGRYSSWLSSAAPFPVLCNSFQVHKPESRTARIYGMNSWFKCVHSTCNFEGQLCTEEYFIWVILVPLPPYSSSLTCQQKKLFQNICHGVFHVTLTLKERHQHHWNTGRYTPVCTESHTSLHGFTNQSTKNYIPVYKESSVMLWKPEISK